MSLLISAHAIHRRILVHKSIDTSILFISNASKSDSGFYNFSVIDSGFVSSTAMRDGFSLTNQKAPFFHEPMKTRISVLVVDVPSEPRNVRIAEHTPNSAMLEWEPPDDNGGVDLIGNVRFFQLFANQIKCSLKSR